MRTKIDPYFGFVYDTDYELHIYEQIHAKRYKCLTPYTGSKNFIQVSCPSGHISSWLPKKAIIPCNNCKTCWDAIRLHAAERISQIITSKDGKIISPYTKSNIPVKIQCEYEHIFESKPDNIMSGSWCTICAKNNVAAAKIKMETIIVSKKGRLLSPYINSTSKVDIECEEKHIFHSRPVQINRNQWCPFCAGNSPIAGKLRFEQNVADKKGTLLSPYVNNDQKVWILCDKQHTFCSAPYSVNFGRWCRKCANQCPEQAYELFVAVVSDNGGVIIGEYKNTHTKIDVKCHLGHIFNAEPNQIKRGSWCPFCAKNSPIQAQDNFRQIVKSRNGTMIGTYINSQTKIDIMCEKGHNFSVSPSNASNGRWCRKCSKLESYGERKIRLFLESKNIPHESEKIFDWLPRKRYDFFIAHNDKVFIIEYDGIQHFQYVEFFHGTPNEFQRKQNVDITKTSEALKRGYYFIRIAYSDIAMTEEIIDEIINDPSPTSLLSFSDDSMYSWLLDPLKQIFIQ